VPLYPPSPALLLRDITVALGFYTRLPVQPRGDNGRSFAASQWAAPVAGAAIGLGVGGTVWLCISLGLPATVAAAFGLAAGIALSGALHEDGLADTADGFGGGRTVETKLVIMRDSRIGSYGVLALGLSLLLRWAALSALADASIASVAVAAVAAHAASRATLPALLATLPPARSDGLSAGIGAVNPPTVLAALAIGLLLLLPGGLAFAAAAAVVLGLASFLVARLALRQIKGQTGDVLGAAQQAGEIAVLCAATIFLVP
jgi:adenosylcobinamide-GDP ribazoletransferase